MRPFDFHRSTSVADALTHQTQTPASAFVAGGTTLIDLVKLNVLRPDRVIDINRLPLTQVEALPDGRLRVGALVRNSDLAWNEHVRRRYPVLAQAILAGASAQLRNMATTGGNLLQRTRCPYFRDNLSPCNKRAPGSGCAALEGFNRSHALLGTSEACIATHPSDMCVGLAVLDVEVVVQGASGERRIPYASFHLLPGQTPDREFALQPGELITGITIGALRAGARQTYVKLRDRESFEFALASAAVVVDLDGRTVRDARIAFGGIATVPWRSAEAEAILRGADVTEETFNRAADAALRDARPRKHNAFKVELAKQALRRALQEATA
jgi:xanthine dehydrogenase YagS FAD-binding subunit